MIAVAEKLKEKNLKVTPQRIAIYNMLCSTSAHPSAESIYKALEETYPTMSLATVYKTLDTLKTTGLIQELNVGEDAFRYDANNMPHAHFICTHCNEVYDLPCISLLDAVKSEIAADTGFTFEKEQIYFYGVCKECMEKEAVAK